MQALGYRVTLEHQAGHWWYRSRRELWLRQVERAARAVGYPGRRLQLLDYGCAAGFDLASLARFGEAHGADTADAPPSSQAFPIHRVPDDLAALRGRFHVVTCLDVLEHLDDDVDGLRAIGALLAPGGQLVATVPAYDWLWSGEDVISAHRRRYTRERLLDAARAAGFEILFSSYFFASVLPGAAAVVWGRRLFSRDWQAQTNLDAHPRWLGGLLRAVTAAEARLVGDERVSLPAGASLVCRLRLRGAIMSARDDIRWRPWRDRPLVFGAPTIGQAERDEVIACLESGWLGPGPRVAELERRFAAYLGAPAAVAVSSCSAALHLALTALDLPPGSEVITTSMTFCATAHAIVHAGCEPVFADCDPHTLNIDVADVRRKITPRTRAILAVHFAGRPCDVAALDALAREHGLAFIEDAAHALEATVGGRHCGTFGAFGAFSFYPTKSVTTGDGGLLVARDPRVAERLRRLALHGMTADAWSRHDADAFAHYEVVELGFKYNLTDFAAALGLHQIAAIDERWQRRRTLWRRYEEELAGLPLHLPTPPDRNTRHALHLFTCVVDDAKTSVTRDEVLARLHALRIGTGVHYRAVHLHPFYQRAYGRRTGSLPGAEWVSARTFSLPLAAGMTDDDAADVVRAVRLVLS